MGENEENEDVKIATSSRGFKKSEDRGFRKLRIEYHRTEDRGFKPKCEDQATETRNLGNEILIENDCLKAS